jgi:hypothetical protein
MHAVDVSTRQNPRHPTPRSRLGWEFDEDDFPAQAVSRAFRTFGIVVVRNALSQDEVRQVRAELDCAFASEHMRDAALMCGTELLRYPAVWSMMFKDRVVRALRAALGSDLCYHQDLDVQRNSYGQIGWQRHTGWHMDSGSEGANAYIRAADYRFAKCGIFLQDFDNGWGGGIRIKPKSHRGHSAPDGLLRRLFFARRVLTRVASMVHLDVDTFHVPTRAGDMCFFDSRLLHSSVTPNWDNIKQIGYDRTPRIQGFWPDIPPQHAKYVIYWDSSNAAMVSDFLRNSIKRAEGEPPGMVEQRARLAYFTRTLTMRFPDDFPPGFVRAATERQIGVVTLSKQETDFYKSKLQTMRLIQP